MSDEDIPAPDQIPGAPHPRETERLFGHDPAQAEFLNAFGAGRLHHAWLISGPKGVGKATLAWRIARFLLSTPEPETDGLFGAPPPPETLAVPPDHPVARRILAGAEPGLAAVTRTVNDKGRMRDQIVVEDIRRLSRFFGLSAADGGHRVVIVDAADEMNVSAANALLKMLEEPPARTTILLISHQPSQLLPTIRSRCRSLRLGPLNHADLAAALSQAGAETSDASDSLSELSGGSVGAALRLSELGGLELYARLVAVLSRLPQLDRQAAIALADSVAARNASDRFDLLLDLIDILLARLARTGACGEAPLVSVAPGEADLLIRLSPSPQKSREWAALAATIVARARHGQAVNLDPAALVLDTVFKIQETASG